MTETRIAFNSRRRTDMVIELLSTKQVFSEDIQRCRLPEQRQPLEANPSAPALLPACNNGNAIFLQTASIHPNSSCGPQLSVCCRRHKTRTLILRRYTVIPNLLLMSGVGWIWLIQRGLGSQVFKVLGFNITRDTLNQHHSYDG